MPLDTILFANSEHASYLPSVQIYLVKTIQSNPFLNPSSSRKSIFIQFEVTDNLSVPKHYFYHLSSEPEILTMFHLFD